MIDLKTLPTALELVQSHAAKYEALRPYAEPLRAYSAAAAEVQEARTALFLRKLIDTGAEVRILPRAGTVPASMSVSEFDKALTSIQRISTIKLSIFDPARGEISLFGEVNQ
jgi:hypothetical protein